MIPIINASKNKNDNGNQVKWQSNDNVTIRLSAHRIGEQWNKTKQKMENDEKTPQNRIAWCKFVSFTRQLFHCVYACVFISNVVQRVYSLLIAIILLLISFYIFPFFKRAKLPSLLPPRMPHTNADVACILYTLIFVFAFCFNALFFCSNKKNENCTYNELLSGTVNTINDTSDSHLRFFFWVYVCVTQVRKYYLKIKFYFILLK